MIDRQVFFDLIRPSLFAGALKQTQVTGISAILDETERQGLPIPYTAYILATPYIETGARYEPIEESLNYTVEALLSKFSRTRISAADAQRYGRSSAHPANQEAIANCIYGGPWGAANLGNTQPGDGWLYRGRNLSQITGRRLYLWLSQISGVDVIADPTKALDLKLGAKAMVEGMTSGEFTGKKLSEYLDKADPDYFNARRTVNGTDRAGDIAAVARKFATALVGAQTDAGPADMGVPISPPPAKPSVILPASPPTPQPDDPGPTPPATAPPSNAAPAVGGGTAAIGAAVAGTSGGHGAGLWIGIALLAIGIAVGVTAWLQRRK